MTSPLLPVLDMSGVSAWDDQGRYFVQLGLRRPWAFDPVLYEVTAGLMSALLVLSTPRQLDGDFHAHLAFYLWFGRMEECSHVACTCKTFRWLNWMYCELCEEWRLSASRSGRKERGSQTERGGESEIIVVVVVWGNSCRRIGELFA